MICLEGVGFESGAEQVFSDAANDEEDGRQRLGRVDGTVNLDKVNRIIYDIDSCQKTKHLLSGLLVVWCVP